MDGSVVQMFYNEFISSRSYENRTSWLLEATHLKPTQLK